MNKLIKGSICILLGFGLIACKDGFSTSSSEAYNENYYTDNNIPIPAITVSKSVSEITAELASSHSATLTINNPAKINRSFDIVVETPEIEALDAMGGVSAVASVGSITVAANSSGSFDVRVNVATTSPSLSEHFHVDIYEAGTTTLAKAEELDLTIVPTVRIEVRGAGDANWSVGGQDFQSMFGDDDPVLEFVSHTAGLQVIFENWALVNQTIHSAGPVPHGDSMARSMDGSAPGGNYSPAPIMPAMTDSSSVYLHDLEGGRNGRELRFNVDITQ